MSDAPQRYETLYGMVAAQHQLPAMRAPQPLQARPGASREERAIVTETHRQALVVRGEHDLGVLAALAQTDLHRLTARLLQHQIQFDQQVAQEAATTLTPDRFERLQVVTAYALDFATAGTLETQALMRNTILDALSHSIDIRDLPPLQQGLVQRLRTALLGEQER